MMSKRKARRKQPQQPVGILLMELAGVHGRLLALIEDPTVRAMWEAELEAHTELIYQSTKEMG